MDHLTPGYRQTRLSRPLRPQVLRTLAWGTLGTSAGLVAILCALVAPSALVFAGLLGGLMFGATRP
jgi:hypothetical protein